VSDEDTVPEDRVLLAEAKSGVAGEPAVAQPEPVQHHLVAALVEVRDVEAAVDAAPHDGLPAEHRLASEELTEDRDALRLNGEEVSGTELIGERVVVLERLVDGVAPDHARLVGMEPLLHIVTEVVLRGARRLEAHELLREPARVCPAGQDHERAVHADREVQQELGGTGGLGDHNQLVGEKELTTLHTTELVEHRLHTDAFHRHVVLGHDETFLRLLVGIVPPPARQRAAVCGEVLDDPRW